MTGMIEALREEFYMSYYFTFHKTIRGYLHKIKDIPCEDFSESCSEVNGRFHIAVVADGHGAAAYMRSADGSHAAARIARECLEDFAQKYLDSIDKAAEDNHTDFFCENIYDKLALDNNARKLLLKQLTDTIISRWFSFVEKDLNDSPLSEEECRLAGKPEHAYGTTLIAALMLPDYLILLQQGDGHCEVFYEDGTIEQPIPSDERCHENVTTSMCDEDVVTNIRSYVISLNEKRVTACYLGSDGVEDAYRNMEGTHNFYRALTCRLNEMGKDGFETYLEDYLPEFSRKGSGDDVSVSGIVNMDSIIDDIEQFQKQIRHYELTESLVQYENRIISMSRKHGILLERKKEAEEAEKQLKEINLKLSKMQEEYIECNQRKEELIKVVSKHRIKVELAETQLKKAREMYKKQRKKIKGNWFMQEVSVIQAVVLADMNCRGKEYQLVQKKKQLERAEEELECEEREHERILYKLKELERQAYVNSLNWEKDYEKRRQEFDEYDHTYRAVVDEIERINNEINLLKE